MFEDYDPDLASVARQHTATFLDAIENALHDFVCGIGPNSAALGVSQDADDIRDDLSKYIDPIKAQHDRLFKAWESGQ